MTQPLPSGHVHVRLTGDEQAAAAVLDRLEAVFPTHTGRGRTRIGNAWEDPPTLTSERTWTVAPAAPAPGPSPAVSQTFDVTTAAPSDHAYAAPGRLAAELHGTAEAVEALLRALADFGPLSEEGRDERGPVLTVRLRLGEPAGRA